MKMAIELDPNYPEPYYALGRLSDRVGDKEGARKAFEAHQRLKEKKSTKQ
jgi:hypothetical protein